MAAEAKPALTKRIDLNLGYSCNQKCRFCYYRRSREDGKKEDLSTAKARRLMRFFRKRGIEIVEFTGGEPTIRGDLAELTGYAREIGFSSVSIITNGSGVSDPASARELVRAGMDDFLVSLHGPDPGVHDLLTETPGSFDRAVRAVEALRSLGVRVRTNTTVTAENYRSLPGLAELIVSLGVRTMNLILFNPIVEAGRGVSDIAVRYSEVAPVLRQVIDRYASRFDKLTVRYIPFCVMEGYERFITNMPQLQYDPDEWNYLVRTRVREGLIPFHLALAAGIALLPGFRRFPRTDWETTAHEGIKRFLAFKNKVKPSRCRSCRYFYICDGLWIRYARQHGVDELHPVPGEVMTRPYHFMRQ